MTRRKPLVWYESDFGPTPDCVDCLNFLLCTPMLAESISSVSIEHPVDLRQLINDYHVNRHKETP